MTEITRGTYLPRSVVNTLHYYILLNASKEELEKILKRENIEFFVKGILREIGYNPVIEAIEVVEANKDFLKFTVRTSTKVLEGTINIQRGELLLKVDVLYPLSIF